MIFLSFLMAASAAPPPTTVFHPDTVSFHDLVDAKAFEGTGRAALRHALQHVGLVQVTGIPDFPRLRTSALTHAHSCLHLDGVGLSTGLDDGTIRRTVATRTVAGTGGAQPLQLPDGAACPDFSAASEHLRRAAGEVVHAFAARLSSMVDAKAPLLSTPSGFEFDTIADVVDAAEHLEHFHAYSKARETPTSPRPTLEMHTDQGLFIAFAPALLTRGGDVENVEAAAAAPTASDFFIRLSNGTDAAVAFDPDALVLMLGEGTEQIVGPKLGTARDDDGFRPRATPHTLFVAATEDDEARMWYGRMVLPPSTALIPGTGTTYEETRSHARATASTRSVTPSIGCSGALGLESHAARSLQATEPSCAVGTLYCWHRCMEQALYSATEAECAAQNLQVQCVNPRDQLYPGGHGDYFPACTNTTEAVTPYPPLPTAPRADVCDSAEAFDAFAAADAYDASVDLIAACGDASCRRGRLMWSVVDDDLVDVKMVADSLFGWLAVGLENPGGGHNGMKGGRIVLGLPAPPATYTAQEGLKLAEGGPSVNEFVIGETESAFRHWSTPFPDNSLVAAAYEVDDCFVSMSFKTNSIAGWPINVSGTDSLIWGVNGNDYFVGYHGRGNRGKVVVKWAGEAEHPPPLTPTSLHPPSPAPSPPASGGGDDGVSVGAVVGIAIGALVVGVALGCLGGFYASKRGGAASEKKPADVGEKGANGTSTSESKSGEREQAA